MCKQIKILLLTDKEELRLRLIEDMQGLVGKEKVRGRHHSSTTPSSFQASRDSLEIVTHFKETMKQLSRLQDHLRCVICGTIPDDAILSTSRCEHKYCRKCITLIEGKICLICDVRVSSEDVKVDNFSTGLIVATKKFANVLQSHIKQ